MDAERFDNLVRLLLLDSSRRGVLAGLTSGLIASLPLLPGGDEVAGKKRRKKKKHKKKKKRTSCTPDCAGKACGDDGCGGSCGTCPFEQVCQDDECVCPNQLIKCGDACIEGQQCCTDDECPGVTTCGVSHFCTCPDTGDILCSAEACCQPGVEVCPVDRSDPFAGSSCQAGGCPESDICNSETVFRCTPECVCSTSVDGVTVCTEGNAPECVSCTHDDDCTTAFGEAAMCIANGPHCGDFCPGLTAICVTKSCPDAVSRRAGTKRTRSLVGRLADTR